VSHTDNNKNERHVEILVENDLSISQSEESRSPTSVGPKAATASPPKPAGQASKQIHITPHDSNAGYFKLNVQAMKNVEDESETTNSNVFDPDRNSYREYENQTDTNTIDQ